VQEGTNRKHERKIPRIGLAGRVLKEGNNKGGQKVEIEQKGGSREGKSVE
jgi:hypothetical protein